MPAADTDDPGGTDKPPTAAGDDLPELTDDERWGKEVTGEATGVLTWGTHRQWVRVQEFEDGTGNVQIAAPKEPPCCAEEWIADWLEAGIVEAAAAQILADRWGIDISEVSK